MSLIILGILLAYGSYKLYILVNRINPNVSKQGFKRNLNDEEAYKP